MEEIKQDEPKALGSMETLEKEADGLSQIHALLLSMTFRRKQSDLETRWSTLQQTTDISSSPS